MKTSCKVIQDLLPLYHDNVCSEESCILVGEHLKECELCKQVLKDIGEELVCVVAPNDQGEPIKAIKFAWEKSKTKAFFKGTLITVIICAILVGGFIGLTQWKIIPVSPDLLEVSEISQLSDGRIIYHLSVKDDKELHFVKFTTNKDGTYYMTPMRSVIEGKRKMDSGLFNYYYMVDIAENNAYQKNYGEGIVITSCYMGPKDNGILIWEDGMELPVASKELEKAVLGNN